MRLLPVHILIPRIPTSGIVMRFTARSFLILGAALAAVTSVHAQVQPDEQGRIYQPFLEVQGRLGHGPELTRPTLFVPLVQSPYDVLFADVTGTVSDADSVGVNAGLGYRTINTEGWIFGRYAYFDYLRTAEHNTIYQATLGVEWMNVEWDVRFNGYLPQESGELVSPHVALFDPQLETIVVRRDEELAYYGTDFEVGYLLGDWYDGDVELRGYAGGFYFDRNVSQFEAITGPRVRMELRAFDLPFFGNGSRLMLGAQYQYDDVRGSQGTGLVSVRLPFGTGGYRPKLDRLQRRMLNPVVRDINIIAVGGTRTEFAIDPETGLRFGEVSVVDATTADIPADVMAAGPDSTVFIEGSQGPVTTTAPIVLQNGQTVRGAGIMVTGEDSRKRVRYDIQPVINGTDPAQDVFVLADESTLRHTIITGGRNGIFGADVSEVVVREHQVSDTQQAGIRLTGSFEGEISDNFVTMAGTNGIQVDTLANSRLNDNTASVNGGSGIVVAAFDTSEATGNATHLNTVDGFRTGDLTEAMIGSNVANENGNNGFTLGIVDSGRFEFNEAMNNGGDGFEVASMGFTAGSDAVFAENTAEANGQHGFHFLTADRGNIEMNLATGNTLNGFHFDNIDVAFIRENRALGNLGDGLFASVMAGGTISANTFDGNTGHGLRIVTMNNGLVIDNTVTDNGLDGIRMNQFFGQINRNAVTGNLNGLFLNEFVGGFILNNSFADHFGDGVFIADYNSGSLDENLATNNGDDGFDIGSTVWSAGSIDDNTATGNTNFGFRIQNRVPVTTTASGNAASGNGDNTVPN